MDANLTALIRDEELRGLTLQEILDLYTDPAGIFAKHNRWLETNMKIAKSWKGMVKLPKDQVSGGAFVDAHRSSPGMAKKLKESAEADPLIAEHSRLSGVKETEKALNKVLFKRSVRIWRRFILMIMKTDRPQQAKAQIQRWISNDIERSRANLQREVNNDPDCHTMLGFFEEWSAWYDMTLLPCRKLKETEHHAENYLVFSTIRFAIDDMRNRIRVIQEALGWTSEHKDRAAADKLDSGSDMHLSTTTSADTQRQVSPLQETYQANELVASENAFQTSALPEMPYHGSNSGRSETSLPPDQLSLFAGDIGIWNGEDEDLLRAIALSHEQHQEEPHFERVGISSFGVYNIPCAFDDLPQNSKLEGMTIEINPHTAQLEFKFQGLPFGDIGGYADIQRAEWVIDPENMTCMSYSHSKSKDAILELLDNGGNVSVPLYIEFTGKGEMYDFIDYTREWMAPDYQNNVFERQVGVDRLFGALSEK
ncbi:hypothetical protein EAE96_008636 [Botrytis aclada]|nr:hypothetical protein EAE96_008636 [Botrytis aclada]